MFFSLSKFSRPFGLFSKISGPRVRIMSSKSSSSLTRAPPSLLAYLHRYHPNHQHHHLVHYQTQNPFVHQALLNIGTGILWFLVVFLLILVVNNNHFTMMNPHCVVLNKFSHNQMWSDDSHTCLCHTILAIFTGTNNCILILFQCRCMPLCGFNKFIHLFMETCLKP